MMCLMAISGALAASAEVGARGTPYVRCGIYTMLVRAPFGGRRLPVPNFGAIDASGKHLREFDEICNLKTSEAAGAGENRCPAAQSVYCEGPAPTLTNPRDVPNGGTFWFHYPGSGGIPAIRCMCGCFVGSTQVLTNLGWHDIRRVAQHIDKLGLRVELPALGEGVLSAPRARADFSIGPETVPVLRFATLSGESITLTDKHPVLVVDGGEKKMVQARAVEIGASLLTTDGQLTEVVSIESLTLPEDDNRVYNLRTGDASGEGGIIAANGLRMGDLTWQLRLSERESREANLLEPTE
jgi:hypothetical protein